MADIWKDTYNKDYIKVVFQQSQRAVLDAELNEMQDILRKMMQKLSKYGIGNMFVEDTFKVSPSGIANKVIIKSGEFAIVEGYIISLEEDVTISLPIPPTSGNRVDKVYLHLYESEINSVDDPNIKYPGYPETAVRLKLNVEIKVAEGINIPKNTETNKYILLADINRHVGVSLIQEEHINEKRAVFNSSLVQLNQQGEDIKVVLSMDGMI